MALSDVKIRSAKPEAKAYKLTDGEGMMLLVHPTVTALKVKFDGTAHAVNQRLLSLDSGSNVASGVGIEIADKNGSAIPLYSASGDYTLDEGSNTLDFTARYVSTGTTVTTGTANATSQFTLNYR